MPALVLLWICSCAYLNCAGWILSALHQLNAGGYAVALAIWAVTLVIWRKQFFDASRSSLRWKKLSRRFKKIFPLAFLIVALLEFIGGAICPPNNYDALTYRLPRILNWLSNGQWFWIPTANARMNYSATGWEWLGAPFFALLHSDRGLFLINVLAFSLMPGLLFGIFYRLGVARKVAWTWMWIVPLIYGCATQAGSIGNDLIGVVFALASIFFGLRARTSGKISDIWLAGLAAALMTSTKLSNLPLLLPCVVAVWPALAELRARWRTGFAIACIAILISGAPTAILNHIHTGSWTGDPENEGRIGVTNPIAGFLGNSLLLAQQCLMPPIFPQAHKANEWINQHLLPVSTREFLHKHFPRYGGTFNELPQEENSGIGCGISLLLLAGIVTAIFGGSKFLAHASHARLVHVATWIAAICFMLKMGAEGDSRLILPYYPLLIATFLLLPSHQWLLRFRAWKIFAVLMALSILPGIILSPSRPLWPAIAVSQWLAQQYPQSPMTSRITTVYSTYAHRNDLFAPLRAQIPADVRKIGFIAENNDSDYSFWRPFGQRQIIYLQNEIKAGADLPEDVQWIVVKPSAWPKYSSVPLEQWEAQHHAQNVSSISVTSLVSAGAERWDLLHVQNN